jgi:hypothetical protein
MDITPGLCCAAMVAISSTLVLGCGTATTMGEADTGGPGIDASAHDAASSDAASGDGASGDGAAHDASTTPDSGSDSAADAGSDAGSDGGSDAARVDGGGRVPMHHRVDDSACVAAAPPGNCSFGGGPSCSTDSDCTAGTNGRCNMNTGGAAFCRCTYDACVHDTDCATGVETCACHGAAFHPDSNECIASGCRVDSDCGASGFCSPTIGGCGGLVGYYCHTAGDLCLDDADCTGGAIQACEYVSAASRWECVNRLFCP